MIKELVIGTTNPAKIEQVRGVLSPLGIAVTGIKAVLDESLLPTITEDGQTVSENARKKAIAYAEATQKTVLSMDNAFYIVGLPDAEQPGTHVRRLPKKPDGASDAEVLDYYCAVIERLGGRTTGRWDFAICVATPLGQVWETIIKCQREITSQRSLTVVKGYPLESISIDPRTGQYVSEYSQAQQDQYWQQEIGEPLRAFIQSLPL